MTYVVATLIVFGVNLMPAFGPPTWALLVLLKFDWHLNSVLLVALGAAAAGAGRFVLARAAYALRERLSARRRANLEAARQRLESHRAGAVLGLGLFALSPVPSAQLFEAAGVLSLRLVPLTLAFFGGRIISYSLYLSAAALAEHSYGHLFTQQLTSPLGIAIQFALLAAIVLVTEIDWTERPFGRSRTSPSG